MPTPPDSPGKAPGLDLMRLLVIAACTTYLTSTALAIIGAHIALSAEVATEKAEKQAATADRATEAHDAWRRVLKSLE